MCAATDNDGLAHLTTEQLAEKLPQKIGEKRAAAAVRALAAAGALSVEPPSNGRVFMRLLAAANRISYTLAGERQTERELLRALWRLSRAQLEYGTSIDLDELPSAFGGAIAVTPILKRLESEQFLMWNRVGGGFRLDERRKTPLVTPIDWSALDKRRKGDLARLDATQGYAQCRTCRRAFVLRYFGDAAARPRCDACDRCIGSKVERSV